MKLEDQFLTKSKFTKLIQGTVAEMKIPYMDAILLVCEKNDIEIDDIRKFISIIEKTIIETLKDYKIDSFPDKKNIGIWYNDNSNIKKIAAIAIKAPEINSYAGISFFTIFRKP